MSSLFEIDKAKAKPATFGDYTDAAQLKRDIELVLKKVCSDIGVKDKLPDNRLMTIMGMMSKYYREFSIKDIVDAFELMLVGELDDFLPKDKKGQAEKNHYQDFSVEYFLRILNGYRKRKISRNPVKALLPEKVVDEKEKAIRHGNYLDDLVKWADNSKMEGSFVSLGWEFTYDLFLKWGLVPEDGKMVLKYKAPVEKAQFQERKKERPIGEGGFAFQYAKYIREAIKNLHENGQTLKEIILKFEYDENNLDNQ